MNQIDAAPFGTIALYSRFFINPHFVIAFNLSIGSHRSQPALFRHAKNFDLNDYEKMGLDQNTIEAIQEDALGVMGWDASVIATNCVPDILNNMSGDDLGCV